MKQPLPRKHPRQGRRDRRQCGEDSFRVVDLSETPYMILAEDEPVDICREIARLVVDSRDLAARDRNGGHQKPIPKKDRDRDA